MFRVLGSLREEWPSCHLFDVRIDAVTAEQVLAAARTAVETRRRLLIGVVNAAKLVHLRSDEALRRSVLGADIILADGMSIVWACRWLGHRLPERVTGIDLMNSILEYCNIQGRRVFCLGATEEALSHVVKHIETQYPRVRLVGARNGYFEENEEPAIADEIAKARPDVLFVAMTSPKKERFLARWVDRIGVPVCHGVGGAFDVLAGKTRRAPILWQRLGLEWLFRIVQEPRRLWKRYLLTNTAFLLLVLWETLRRVKRATLGTPRPKAWRRVRVSHH